MQTIQLESKKREVASHGRLNLLRRSGELPCVVYGGSKSTEAISVNGKLMFQILKEHGTNVIVNLMVNGKPDTALVKDVQRDPISHKIVHVDFQRISMKEKIEVSVPIHVKGEAPGVKLSGGILEHILRELRIRCLPMDIPTALDVDVSSLQITQSIKVKDMQLPSGLEVLTDKEQIVVNIVSPTVLEETTPAAAAAVPGAAEPEVIAKGKKPEEGEAAAAAAPAAGKEKEKPAK